MTWMNEDLHKRYPSHSSPVTELLSWLRVSSPVYPSGLEVRAVLDRQVSI